MGIFKACRFTVNIYLFFGSTLNSLWLIGILVLATVLRAADVYLFKVLLQRLESRIPMRHWKVWDFKVELENEDK